MDFTQLRKLVNILCEAISSGTEAYRAFSQESEGDVKWEKSGQRGPAEMQEHEREPDLVFHWRTNVNVSSYGLVVLLWSCIDPGPGFGEAEGGIPAGAGGPASLATAPTYKVSPQRHNNVPAPASPSTPKLVTAFLLPSIADINFSCTQPWSRNKQRRKFWEMRFNVGRQTQCIA